MSSSIHGLLVHLRVRVRAVVTDPSAILVMLLFGVAATVIWPRFAVESPSLETLERVAANIGYLIWIALWPALPMAYAAGRASGCGSDTEFVLRALPALPPGPRTRAIAETLVVLAFVLLVRHGALFAMPGGETRGALEQTIDGALITLPTVLAWGLPARSFNFFFWRPFVVAALLFGANGVGLMASDLSTAVVCAALCLAVLATWQLDPSLFSSFFKPSSAGPMYRTAGPVDAMLSRDLWELPARSFGIPVVLALVVFVVAFVRDLRVQSTDWVLFAAAEIVLVATLIPLLRPFNSKELMAGLLGRWGYSSGDCLRAWSMLPVRPEAVLRRIWLWGFLGMSVLWLGCVGLVLLRSWFRTGELALRAGDGGHIGIVLLPFGVLVLMVPGFLVAAAAGDRKRTALAGIPIFLTVHVHLIVFSLLQSAFGRSSMVPIIVDTTFLVLITLIAATPSISLLKAPERGD